MLLILYMKDMTDPLPITRRSLLAAATLPAAAGRRPGAGPSPLPLVMLDPGHGGRDPGAIGVSGTYEKHVAFAAAQELRRQLLAAKLCRVALTRTGDAFIPLRSGGGRRCSSRCTLTR